MPVGLNLLETVESKLLDAGLLPRDTSVLHRVIDFSKGDFTLRWNSPESDHHTVAIRLVQQLAQRKSDKPMMTWNVTVDDSESVSRGGRIVLNSKTRAVSLAAEVTSACQDLLASVRTPDPAPVVEPEFLAETTEIDESLLSGSAD